MNAQVHIDQKLTTIAGVSGGVLSWILGNIEVLTKVVSFLGTVCGASVALISLILKLRELRRRRRDRERPFTEPADLDDQIPLP